MSLKDADKLIELIDDDISSLNKDMSREGYDVCLCTLQMVKQYIKALPTAEPIKHGRWVKRGDNSWECSVCHEISCCNGNYCVDCGARMDGINKSVESVDLGNGFSISVNKSQIDTQGRYCPECLHSPTCYGAGISKPACKAFVPRVRYVDSKDGGENDI